MARTSIRLGLAGLLIPLLACLAWLPGCSDDGPVVIEKVREIPAVDPRELIERTHADRFALALPPSERPGAEPAPQPPGRIEWEWLLPEGWKENEASGMRAVSIEVPAAKADAPPADVAAFLLPLSPMLDNVNRWRGQLGQGPVAEADLASMAYDWRGEQAILVDLVEDTGGGPDAPPPSKRFIGLLVPFQGRLFSVKIVGPVDVVNANETKFHAFLQSLAAKEATRGVEQPTPPTDPKTRGLRERLQWDTPSGWAAERAKGGMRVASFRIANAPELDVRIVALRGDGGGLAQNARRWAGQAGHGPVTDETLAKLPRIEVLGTQAVLCDFEGRTTLGGGTEEVDAVALGLICLLEGESLFVYVLGAKQDLAPHRASFVSLCRSLRFEE